MSEPITFVLPLWMLFVVAIWLAAVIVMLHAMNDQLKCLFELYVSLRDEQSADGEAGGQK